MSDESHGYKPLGGGGADTRKNRHGVEDPENVSARRKSEGGAEERLLKVPEGLRANRLSGISMVSVQEHSERKAFLYFVLALLIVSLSDLLYNEPLYDLTLKHVPPW
jgi:hypothetical protein